MPFYQSPGVYIQEVAGTPPIAGVGTSTAGFIGIVDDTIANLDGTPFKMPEKPTPPPLPPAPLPALTYYAVAPVEAPCLVTNWEQFKNQFGEPQAGNLTLAHAVYGFFNNLGTRCWVARVTNITNVNSIGRVLKKFEAIDEIALALAPGALTKGVQDAIADHCKNLGDRFAILDGLRVNPPTTTASVQGTTSNNPYAAMYFPWIEVNDLSDSNGKRTLFVPPSGHIAGIYARVDQQRGVHKAPANEVVQGALSLEYSTSKSEQDGLNPGGINVIRNLNGAIRVWGARTLGGDAQGEYKYINVRRTMNFIEESIDEGTQFAVFEPNNIALWQQLKRAVTAFLTIVWRDGALFGDTAEQAFFVRCDAGLNPPEVRDLGQVIVEVGVAIVRPAEFVIFRISQFTGPAAQ